MVVINYGKYILLSTTQDTDAVGFPLVTVQKMVEQGYIIWLLGIPGLSCVVYREDAGLPRVCPSQGSARYHGRQMGGGGVVPSPTTTISDHNTPNQKHLQP